MPFPPITALPQTYWVRDPIVNSDNSCIDLPHSRAEDHGPTTRVVYANKISLEEGDSALPIEAVVVPLTWYQNMVVAVAQAQTGEAAQERIEQYEAIRAVKTVLNIANGYADDQGWCERYDNIVNEIRIGLEDTQYSYLKDHIVRRPWSMQLRISWEGPGGEDEVRYVDVKTLTGNAEPFVALLQDNAEEFV